MRYLFKFYPENLRIVLLENMKDLKPEIFSKDKWFSYADAYFNGKKEMFCDRNITIETSWILLRNKKDKYNPRTLLITSNSVNTRFEIYTGKPEIDYLVNHNLQIIAPTIAFLEKIPTIAPAPNVESEVAWLDSDEDAAEASNSEVAEKTIRA